MMLFNLPISGNRVIAMAGTLLILFLFYLMIKKTWVGLALRGSAQNRVGGADRRHHGAPGRRDRVRYRGRDGGGGRAPCSPRYSSSIPRTAS